MQCWYSILLNMIDDDMLLRNLECDPNRNVCKLLNYVFKG